MTRKEIKEWAKSTVDKILHGHFRVAVIHGFITRDFDGSLYFHKDKPFRHGQGFWYSPWLLKIENQELFPTIKGEDKEPTKATLTFKIDQ